jgi:sortase (surface protein transpeptidase)
LRRFHFSRSWYTVFWLPVVLSVLVVTIAGTGVPPPAMIPTAAPTATLEPTATPTAEPTPTAVLVTSTPEPTATPLPPTPTPRVSAPPVRLRIPRIGVDAPIVPVGLTPGGAMAAPHTAYEVGWYGHGTRPGETGNALLAGHVDYLHGAAVFWHLRSVSQGDQIVVATADGEEHHFAVAWQELFLAEDPPMDIIVGPTDAPAVTLITCGGQFNHAARDYSHRLVVRAVLSD